MPLDKYFTSVVNKDPLKGYEARWRAFSRLSHELQASEIDELLRQSRLRELTPEEQYLVRQFSKKERIYV